MAICLETPSLVKRNHVKTRGSGGVYRLREDLECELRALAGVPWGRQPLLTLPCDSSLNLLLEAADRCRDSRQVPLSLLRAAAF